MSERDKRSPQEKFGFENKNAEVVINGHGGGIAPSTCGKHTSRVNILVAKYVRTETRENPGEIEITTYFTPFGRYEFSSKKG